MINDDKNKTNDEIPFEDVPLTYSILKKRPDNKDKKRDNQNKEEYYGR